MVRRRRRRRGHDHSLQQGRLGDRRLGADGADLVVVALAPICADRFRAQSDSATKIAELAKSSSWDRGNVVAKSGYATMPGSKDPDSDVARACGEMLANPPTPKT